MKKICFILIGFLLLFNACKKETGPQGLTGAIGPSGITGPTGNANVISQNYTTNSNDWNPITMTNNAINEITTISDTNIKQDIYNHGIVLAYMKFTSNGFWSSIDNNYSNGEGIFTKGFYFTYNINTLDIYYYESDGGDPGNPGTVYFKIIILPATVIASYPKADLKNYEEVVKTFNIIGSN